MGQTGRTVNIRISKHRRHVKLVHTDKSVLVPHCWLLGHQIQFDTTVLFKSAGSHTRVTRESLEIATMEGAINEEEGVKLSNTWLSLHERMMLQKE